MFETIELLLTIVLWAAALFLFGGGIISCIGSFAERKAGAIIKSVIAIILGIITFSYVYSWFNSILWCLLFTGIVICLTVNIGESEAHSAPKKESKYGFTQAFVDSYCEYELTKAAVKDAIKESKQ